MLFGQGTEPGTPLGPDFWTTVRAVSPVVGSLVGIATVYLRLAIRDENNKQREAMMTEIRQLFALKETIGVQFANLEKRMDRFESVLFKPREVA